MLTILGLTVVLAPALLLAVLGVATLANRRLSERATSVCVQAAVLAGMVPALIILGRMLLSGERHVVAAAGDWVFIPHYHLSLKFVFDRLSVPFVFLSFLLCGTISAFAAKYMHREPGYHRFFVLYAVFLLGMVVTSLAGTIETLFIGWELVGLSSALLVAFFQERPAPVRNGLRVWGIYRVADAALLLAAMLLHHSTGEGDFDRLMGSGPWPLGQASLSSQQALLVGLLLLVAVAGKSALIPFSGWLPRAMEGPTPSSAIFYGALSVHLGAFLLLRVRPLLELSLVLCLVIAGLGLLTSLHAAITARVQTDIKSALCYAALAQVGLIVAEIALLPRILGPQWAYVPLVHVLGHACLRTLQFVRAPTLLQDYRLLENAIGTRLRASGGFAARLAPRGLRPWIYRYGLERGYLDAILNDFFVRPVLLFFQLCDRLEHRWTDLLAGGASRESDDVPPGPGLVEELP